MMVVDRATARERFPTPRVTSFVMRDPVAEAAIADKVRANIEAGMRSIATTALVASTSPLVPAPAPAPALGMYDAMLADLSDVYAYRGPQLSGETVMRKVRDDFDVQIGGMFRDAVTTGTGALMVKEVRA